MPTEKLTLSDWICFAIIVAIFLVVSSMDYEDEVKREHANYCRLIKRPGLPDYKSMAYALSCISTEMASSQNNAGDKHL